MPRSLIIKPNKGGAMTNKEWLSECAAPSSASRMPLLDDFCNDASSLEKKKDYRFSNKP